MTRKHYIQLVKIFARVPFLDNELDAICGVLKQDNSNFNVTKFKTAIVEETNKCS